MLREKLIKDHTVDSRHLKHAKKTINCSTTCQPGRQWLVKSGGNNGVTGLKGLTFDKSTLIFSWSSLLWKNVHTPSRTRSHRRFT